jgi:hypothetical protein
VCERPGRAPERHGGSSPSRGRPCRPIRHAAILLTAVLLVGAALTVRPPVAVAAAGSPDAGLITVGALARLPRGASVRGALPVSSRIHFGLALQPQDPAGLAALASAVVVPGSAQYHRFVTPTAIARRFGPNMAAIAALERVLRRGGLSVDGLSANHLVLSLSGRVGRIESVFATHLVTVDLPAGSSGWAATTRATLPAAVGHVVAAVVGLDQLAVPRGVTVAPRTRARTVAEREAPALRTPAGAPHACLAATDDAAGGGGWTDAEIAQAYGLNRLFAKGDLAAGQTIDVFELEPFEMSDLARFDRCYFGVSHADQVTTDVLDGFDLTGPGSGESILDIENVSALAPDAHIVVYEAPNTTFGSLDAYNAMVSADTANIITTSWGECEATLETASPGAQQLENTLFEEAAAQGQTVVAASGDTGSDDCASTPFSASTPVAPDLSVDDPASQPYVLGVGGTSLDADTQPLSASDEKVWNDGADSGATGGGISATWPIPAWQADSGVPGVRASGGREVPDVSGSADEWKGVTVYSASFGSGSPSSTGGTESGWTTIGGTSSAAPMWAAMLAEIAASGPAGTACSGLPLRAGGTDLGFVNPLLYAVAAQDYPTSFHDITIGDNDAFGLGLGYSAGPGYDPVTGLGSPILTNPSGAPGLAADLCAMAAAVAPTGLARPVVDGLSPPDGATTGGTTVTVTLAAPVPSGAVLSVQFGTVTASVVSVSGSSVEVTAPAPILSAGSASFAGAGPVTVTVLERLGTALAVSGTGPTTVYEYVAPSPSGPAGTVAPVVAGLSPNGGVLAGGGRVSIFGSGFAGTSPTVTFGGVAASDLTVVSDDEITVSAPPRTAATACATGAGFDPADDCQVDVVVSDSEGTSPVATILPAESGTVVFTRQGIVDPTPTTEVAPATTEYDYAPAPVISAVSPDPASPSGRQQVTIEGAGFSLNTMEWVNFGPAADAADEQIRYTFISGHEIVLDPPGGMPGRLTGGVSVQSIGGLSNAAAFSYGGPAAVTGLSVHKGPSAGGTVVVVHGTSLGVVTAVAFVSRLPGHRVVRVTTAGRSGPRTVRVRTPADLPGPVDVETCQLSSCTRADPRTDVFVFDAPDRPVVTHLSARSGPAAGGATLTIEGGALTSVSTVDFGAVATNAVSHARGHPGGDPSLFSVIVPPGAAGSTVAVRVVTPAGESRVTAVAHYSYRPSPPSPPLAPAAAIVHGTLVVTWSPPASDGGAPVGTYTVVISAAAHPPIRVTVASGTEVFRLAALPVALSYDVAIAATTRYGHSAWATAVVLRDATLSHAG